MSFFRNLSLKLKQMLLMLAIATVALVFSFGGFLSQETALFRKSILETLNARVGVFGSVSTAALEFDDPKAAQEIMSALQSDRNLLAGALYSKTGEMLASYRRSDSPGTSLPSTLSGDGHEDTSGWLAAWETVNSTGEPVGCIYLKSDLGVIAAHHQKLALTGAVVLLLSLLAATFLSSLLQRLISGPVLHLLATMKAVTEKKDFTQRAIKTGNDELGQLVDGFNDMIQQIYSRDAELQQARDHLELRVEERTAELKSEVAEREQAEKRLQDSLLSLAAFKAVLDRACIIATTDTRGTITHANENFCKISGYDRAELVGQNHRLLKSGYHPDSFYAAMWKTITNGEVWRGEIKNVSKTGETYWVDATIGPMLDESGKPKGYLAVRTDITERKMADEERARLVNFLEASLNEVYVFDTESLRFSYVNRRALQNLGYTAEQIRKLTPLDIKPEFTNESFRKAITPLLADAVSKRVFQTIHRRADGTDYPVEVCLQLVSTSKERVFLAVIADITERRRAEAELAEMNKRLLATSRQAGMAEVATGVLHNVGNVLNSVNVSATLLGDQLRKSKISSVGRVCDLLKQNSGRLGEFFTTDAKGLQVPGFLEVLSSQLKTDQQSMLEEVKSLTKNIEHIKGIVSMQQSLAKVGGVTEMVNIPELIEDTLRITSGSLSVHKIELIKDIALELPDVQIDKHKALQILINLVRNAKHACEDSGRADKRITVKAAREEDRILITVADNGLGIPAENLDRIFNHGFTTKKDGHGFGLHSGANAAKEMGGSLRVASEGPGHGATFTLGLPMESKAKLAA